jgi:hypothetical protein
MTPSLVWNPGPAHRIVDRGAAQPVYHAERRATDLFPLSAVPRPGRPGGPVLHLLGPLELSGAAGRRPGRSHGACHEVLAWILEHPGGTPPMLRRDLEVAEGTRRTYLSRLRGWLGRLPDGRLYLPEAYNGRFELHPSVTSDWQQFQQVLVRGPRRTPTEGLVAALHLVRGAPLGGADPNHWAWAEPLRAAMAAAIRDVGVTLADRALDAGDLDLARWATSRALAATEADERLLCTRISVERLAGNRAEVDRLVGWLHRQAYELGVGLFPDTAALLQEVALDAPRLLFSDQLALW